MIKSVETHHLQHGFTFVLMSYISLCLIFGGASRYGLFHHGVLQTIAAIGIAVLALTWPRGCSLKSIILPVGLLVALVVIGVLQCVPIPVSVWSLLPGRGPILEDLTRIDAVPETISLSLDAESTISSLGYALTPLFIFLLCLRIGLETLRRTIPIFFAVVGFVSVALGLSQVYLGADSTLYFYEHTNFGFPVGAFSNVNHFGSLLLMISPFVIMLLIEKLVGVGSRDRRTAWAITLSTLLFLLIVGVASTGSVAVYFMSFPTLIAAVLGVRPLVSTLNPTFNYSAALLFMLSLILAITIVSTSPILGALGAIGDGEGPTSRREIWLLTFDAISEYWPVGSGKGTYLSVVPLFENPESVTSKFFAFAHNEYLQIALEFGAPGLLVIFIAMIWFAVRSKEVWITSDQGRSPRFRKMALIGVWVCVLHSFVDFPVRTPAIAAVLSILVAIISMPKTNRGTLTTEAVSKEKRLVL